MTNPLRQALQDKYGGGSSPAASTSANTSKPASQNALRVQLTKKYASPAPNVAAVQFPKPILLDAPVPKPVTVPPPKPGQAFISSPEYIAKSIDVLNSKGHMVEVVTGTAPGEAEAKARAKADAIGGTIQVTAPGGFIGRAINAAKDTIQNVADNLVQKGDTLAKQIFNVKVDHSGNVPPGTLINDPSITPASKIAAGVDFGTAFTGAILSPIAAAFSAGEEVPGIKYPVRSVDYLFGKVGEAGSWTAGKVVDSLPVSDKTKAEIKPAAQNLSALLAQIAAGKATDVGYKQLKTRTADLRANIQEKISKDIIVKQNLPRTVYIDPVKVKSIFQTGNEISAEENDLIRSLGLNSTQYRQAFSKGLTISIPAEKITTIVDKPWFAKVKSAFNMAPDSRTVVESGKPTVNNTPAGLLPENSSYKDPSLGLTNATEANRAGSGAISPEVQDAISSPITPSLLDKVKNFDQVQSSAFGRSIIQSINDAVGTKISETNSGLPENIQVNDFESADGRPAQFNGEGKIEVFLPNLVKDLKTLSTGGQILAHEGAYSTVYKLEPGESMEKLAVRYTKDVLLHEKAHEKTMTFEDLNKAKQLTGAVTEARLSGNQGNITKAQQAHTTFMRSLEDKANQHLKDNRAALEKELFSKPKVKAPNQFERQALRIPEQNKVVTTEKKLLTERIKNKAAGAREGFAAGKEEGVQATKEQLKGRYEKAIGTVHDKYMSALQKRTALIDYAQLLPLRERGKFLKAIRNTVTEKEYIDVLNSMREAAKLSDRKAIIQQIQKELKATLIPKKSGLPDPKFAYNQQKALNEIRAIQKTTYADAQIKIAELISDHQTAHPDDALPVDLLHQVEILKTAGIKDQALPELANTLSIIQSIKESGRTQKELERFNRDSEIDRARDKIADIITGGKPLPSEKVSLKARREKSSMVRGVKNFFTIENYGLEELMDALSSNDKSTKPYESFLSKYVGEKTNVAFNSEFKGGIDRISQINETLKKVYKIEKKKDILSLLGDMQKVENLGEFKHADGVTRKLEISRGEAMQMYMWHQDETLEKTFEEGLHWTPEIIKKVESVLSPEDIAMAGKLLDFYRTYYESINKIFSKEFGVDLPFNDNYSPVHRNIDVSIPENVLLAQESAKYATAKNGSLKERVKNQIDLKPTDAFQNLNRHITKMEHYMSWSDPMFRFRKIFADKTVRQSIVDFHGEDYLKAVDNTLNDFARGGVAREKVVVWADNLRTNVTKAMLGLNKNVGIKQLAGVLNYGIEVPFKDFVVGAGDFWRAPFQKSQFLYKNSPVLQERFGEGYERDIKFAIEKGYDKRFAGAHNFSETMFLPIRNADKFTVYIGAWTAYRSKYLEAIRDGNSEADAREMGIRNAENVTNRVQESSRLDTLSPLQRGGSMMKIFTMFQNQPSKYLRIMMNATRNYRAGRTDFRTASKRVVWAWVVAPLMYNLLADQFIDKKYREESGGLITRTLLGPLTYPLIVGQMFQQAYGWATGDRFGYAPSPMFSFMDDIQTAIGDFRKKTFSGKDAVDAFTYVADSIGKLTGVPTTVITKGVRNVLKDN